MIEHPKETSLLRGMIVAAAVSVETGDGVAQLFIASL